MREYTKRFPGVSYTFFLSEHIPAHKPLTSAIGADKAWIPFWTLSWILSWIKNFYRCPCDSIKLPLQNVFFIFKFAEARQIGKDVRGDVSRRKCLLILLRPTVPHSLWAFFISAISANTRSMAILIRSSAFEPMELRTRIEIWNREWE